MSEREPHILNFGTAADLHRQREQGAVCKAVGENTRQPSNDGEKVIDSERKSRPENENGAGEEVDGGREGHKRMHVKENQPAVSRFVGHEIHEWLDGARLKIGFSVGVCVVADGVADPPNCVAEATKIEHIRPQIIDVVEKVVSGAASVNKLAE